MVHCVEGFRQFHVDARHMFAMVQSVQNIVNYFCQSQGCWVALSESEWIVIQNLSSQEFWQLFVHNLLHYFIDGAEQTDWPVIAWVFLCIFSEDWYDWLVSVLMVRFRSQKRGWLCGWLEERIPLPFPSRSLVVFCRLHRTSLFWISSILCILHWFLQVWRRNCIGCNFPGI